MNASTFIEENYSDVLREFERTDIEPTVHWQSSTDMSPIPDESVQLVCTSPPYPMIEMWDEMFADALNVESGWIEDHPNAAFSAMHRYLTKIWKECYCVLQPGGILAINIGDATRSFETFQCWPNHTEITRWCRRIGFNSLIPILWRKPTNSPNSFLGSGMLPTNAYVTLDTEYILLFRKGGTRDFPPHDPLRYASQYDQDERDKWFSQVWNVNGAEKATDYAEFPSEIPRRLIQMFSVLGDTVLDPFMGTGTTVIQSRELGRKGIGFEINEDLKTLVKPRIFNHDYPSKTQLLES